MAFSFSPFPPEPSYSGTVALVLAGGTSRRFGRDKRFAPLHGEPLLARAVRLLAEIFPRVVVSANDRPPGLPGGIEVIADIHRDAGPLAGIHAAFVVTGAERIFAHACDIPFPSRELIRRLDAASSDADVALPETETGLEPLHAFYRRSCFAAIEANLVAGIRKAIAFHDRVRVARVRVSNAGPLGTQRIFNINREADLAEAARLASEGAESFAAGRYAKEGA